MGGLNTYSVNGNFLTEDKTLSATIKDNKYDPRLYWGSYEKIKTNPEVYLRGPIYDSHDIWIFQFLGTLYLTNENPISQSGTIEMTNLRYIASTDTKLGEWKWQHNNDILPLETKLKVGACDDCIEDADCNLFRGEMCCDGIIRKCIINGQQEKNKCVHVGFITFVDQKMYVLENVGHIQIPIQRYGSGPLMDLVKHLFFDFFFFFLFWFLKN